jgi:hypothetical protein
MRTITDYVTQWTCGRYFFCWLGDEILMKATNDNDARAEAVGMLEEFNSDDSVGDFDSPTDSDEYEMNPDDCADSGDMFDIEYDR